MTAAMRQLHHRLPHRERYPLPPRLIMEQIGSDKREQFQRTKTIAAHFAFGAAAGSLFAAISSRRELALGAGYGLLVWGASYFGWVPATGLLPPANRHPTRRNLLMAAVHLIWGTGLAAGLRELEAAEREVFSNR
jgi:hypothetical protein